MIRKILKDISIVLLGIGTLLILWITLAIGRFKYNEATTDFNNAWKDKETLLIVYKSSCSRCKETLPRLYLKHVFDLKRENVVNQNRLSNNDKKKIEDGLTPKFFFKGKEYQTKNSRVIDKIWQDSH